MANPSIIRKAPTDIRILEKPKGTFRPQYRVWPLWANYAETVHGFMGCSEQVIEFGSLEGARAWFREEIATEHAARDAREARREFGYRVWPWSDH